MPSRPCRHLRAPGGLSDWGPSERPWLQEATPDRRRPRGAGAYRQYTPRPERAGLQL